MERQCTGEALKKKGLIRQAWVGRLRRGVCIYMNLCFGAHVIDLVLKKLGIGEGALGFLLSVVALFYIEKERQESVWK
jgi:hypothetical protein